MKPKKLNKKLVLNKKTIADLRDLKNAHGGIEESARATCQTGVCAGTCQTCYTETCFCPTLPTGCTDCTICYPCW